MQQADKPEALHAACSKLRLGKADWDYLPNASQRSSAAIK